MMTTKVVEGISNNNSCIIFIYEGLLNWYVIKGKSLVSCTPEDIDENTNIDKLRIIEQFKSPVPIETEEELAQLFDS